MILLERSIDRIREHVRLVGSDLKMLPICQLDLDRRHSGNAKYPPALRVADSPAIVPGTPDDAARINISQGEGSARKTEVEGDDDEPIINEECHTEEQGKGYRKTNHREKESGSESSGDYEYSRDYDQDPEADDE